MKIIWYRAWDDPLGVLVAVETAPDYYETQTPYDQDGNIQTTTHYCTTESMRDAVARGQWVIERELDSNVDIFPR